MNWADYVILAVLLLSVLIGLWRGLLSEVLALVIWVAAAWFAWQFGPDVAHAFDGHIELPSLRLITGYTLCFLTVLLVGALLRFVLARLVESTGLSGSDRLLGMAFGLARGLALVTLAVFLLGFTPFTRDPWWQRSQLLPGFQGAAGWIAAQLPDAVRRYARSLQPLARKLPLPQAHGSDLPAVPASSVHAGARPAPVTVSTQAPHAP